jgi:hypothetical protein
MAVLRGEASGLAWAGVAFEGGVQLGAQRFNPLEFLPGIGSWFDFQAAKDACNPT